MTLRLPSRRRRAPLLGIAVLCAFAGLCLTACQSDSTGPAPLPQKGAARLGTLLHNPRWYRTFDSTSNIDITGGTLLFAWTFADSTRHPDSFYVGIDTLWSLPQDVGGDTANDWDLQVCPDWICMNGLKTGVHGANAAYPFGSALDTGFSTEHHFQFFPALVHDQGYAAEGAVFGALMFVRSRSGSSPTDTVFGFGAWKTPWDSAFPPPVRPTNGHLPKRADFKLVNGKVRYQPD